MSRVDYDFKERVFLVFLFCSIWPCEYISRVARDAWTNVFKEEVSYSNLLMIRMQNPSMVWDKLWKCDALLLFFFSVQNHNWTKPTDNPFKTNTSLIFYFTLVLLCPDLQISNHNLNQAFSNHSILTKNLRSKFLSFHHNRQFPQLNFSSKTPLKTIKIHLSRLKKINKIQFSLVILLHTRHGQNLKLETTCFIQMWLRCKYGYICTMFAC